MASFHNIQDQTTTSTPTPHALKPLKKATENIRLIELLPGSEDEEIRCEFHLFMVSAFPPFTALSYAWGPDNPQHDILLDGQRFQIRENLWEALRAIRKNTLRYGSTRKEKLYSNRIHPQDESVRQRSPRKESNVLNDAVSKQRWSRMFKMNKYEQENNWEDDSRPGGPRQVTKNRNTLYWVDQVCVDQNNISERNHQVSLMKEIYTRATEVLVWLGVSQDLVAESWAMEFVQNQRWKVRALNLDDSGEPISPRNQMLIQSFDNLCQRVYWRRMWIVQEIMLAKRVCVQSGAQRVMLEDFFRAMEYFQDLKRAISRKVLKMIPARPSHLMDWVDKLSNSGAGKISLIKFTLNEHIAADQEISLEMLIALCKNQECSDIRDKIFGLVSLLSKSSQSTPTLAADYSKTPEEVWSTLMTGLFQERSRRFPVQSIEGRENGQKLIHLGIELLDIMNLDVRTEPFRAGMTTLLSEAIVDIGCPSPRYVSSSHEVWGQIFSTADFFESGHPSRTLHLVRPVFGRKTDPFSRLPVHLLNRQGFLEPEVLAVRQRVAKLTDSETTLFCHSTEWVNLVRSFGGLYVLTDGAIWTGGESGGIIWATSPSTWEVKDGYTSPYQAAHIRHLAVDSHDWLKSFQEVANNLLQQIEGKRPKLSMLDSVD